jgi:hypothetical protein
MDFLINLGIRSIFLLFWLRNIQTYLVGNDIQCKIWYARVNAKFLHVATDLLLCRSYANIADLLKLGITNTKNIPDMCFGFDRGASKSTERKIGISFRDPHYPDLTGEIFRTVEKTFGSLPTHSVFFFYQVARDWDFNRTFFYRFSKHPNVSFLENCLTWPEIPIYFDMEFVLRNRLQDLLFGLVHSVFPITLLDEEKKKTTKIRAIFDSVDQTDFVHSTSDSNSVCSLDKDITFLKGQIRQSSSEQIGLFLLRIS